MSNTVDLKDVCDALAAALNASQIDAAMLRGRLATVTRANVALVKENEGLKAKLPKDKKAVDKTP